MQTREGFEVTSRKTEHISSRQSFRCCLQGHESKTVSNILLKQTNGKTIHTSKFKFKN